jgi:hypothetical protein
MPIERQKEIRRRRQRKRKLRMLKTKLAEAKDLTTRERLIEKIKRIQPGFTPPD